MPVPVKGVAKIARKMGFDYAEAVVRIVNSFHHLNTFGMACCLVVFG